MPAPADTLPLRAPLAECHVNDVHSRLNPTVHRRVLRPRTGGELALAEAGRRRERCAVAGARHAMGGQQFAAGGVLIDMTGMRRVLDFDLARGLVTVEAGIHWTDLQRFLASRLDPEGRGWAIRQKQTGADDFTLGGSLAANIHGRGLDWGPFVDDLESLVLVTVDGQRIVADRERQREWFVRAVGGYGLYGVVEALTLRLIPRVRLERTVEIETVDALPRRFAERIAAGYRHGDFQFAVDPRDDDFLFRGVFACYRPVDDPRPMPAARQLDERSWRDLMRLAHVDKRAAFARYAAYYRSTDGQRYWSDEHQFGVYPHDYHDALDHELGHRGSELITEVFVPPARLPDFMAAAAAFLRARHCDVVYGTVRLVRRDATTALPCARADYAGVVFNLHVRHDPEALARCAGDLRGLIGLALEREGSFYLTYHAHADRSQLLHAYPQLPDALALKRRVVPDETLCDPDGQAPRARTPRPPRQPPLGALRFDRSVRPRRSAAESRLAHGVGG